MSTLIRSGRPLRAVVAAACGLAAAVAMVTTSGAAFAAPSSSLHAKYKVTGSTFLSAPDFTLSLGPGKLAATVKGNGSLTANLTLPQATGSFKQGGLIPVTATTAFVNDGPTTGKVNLRTGKVSTTSNITLQITNLVVAGIPIPVGNSCETAQPVVVDLTSQKGFNVLDGGKLAGSYTIGAFHHCGLATLLINLTIPASGNTISLKLGKAKLG